VTASRDRQQKSSYATAYIRHIFSAINVKFEET
jgi:hypothetical protein